MQFRGEVEERDMEYVKKEQMNLIAPLFKDWNETMIWSCLEGYMGAAWADDLVKPRVALIMIGDFVFLAGDSTLDEAEGLVRAIKGVEKKVSLLVIPQNKAWGALIEKVYGEKAEKITRFAIKKEYHIFDKKKLGEFIEALPEGFEIAPIDEAIYSATQKEEWCQDLCSQFPTYQDYKKYGLGFVILNQGKIVSGASSYTIYSKGIEIEIDTHEAYREKGLATVCAAKLILDCLDKGLYPSWDAANKTSVALAEKLGYHFDYEYITYEIT